MSSKAREAHAHDGCPVPRPLRPFKYGLKAGLAIAFVVEWSGHQHTCLLNDCSFPWNGLLPFPSELVPALYFPSIEICSLSQSPLPKTSTVSPHKHGTSRDVNSSLCLDSESWLEKRLWWWNGPKSTFWGNDHYSDETCFFNIVGTKRQIEISEHQPNVSKYKRES